MDSFLKKVVEVRWEHLLLFAFIRKQESKVKGMQEDIISRLYNLRHFLNLTTHENALLNYENDKHVSVYFTDYN